MRLLALLAVLLPCVACDQATKMLAVDHLKGEAPLHVIALPEIGGLFRLVYAENPGAFMSLGAGLPHSIRQGTLIGLVGVLLAGLLFVLLRKKLTPLAFTALGLLLAGGVGNLIDRIWRDGGRVVDFAALQLGPLRTGVFNVADVQIVLAALLLIASTWWVRQHQQHAATATTAT